jgi:hypothetical protein
VDTKTPVALLRASSAAVLGLHYGTARTAMVKVVPDDIYPDMWRMVWPDGPDNPARGRECSEVSDMTNLPRIKDAAMNLCDRGPPRRDRRRFHWIEESI